MFLPSCRCVSLDKLASCVGMPPVSWLFDTSSQVRFDSSPSCVGMPPVSWFLDTSSEVRFDSVPS